MMNVLEALELGGIVPVVVIDDEKHAAPLAQALLAGGLSTMEITFRTNAALGALERIRKDAPGMMIGAGTVLTVEQATAAIDSGAQYIVSPGLNRKIVEYCRSRNILVTPGVVTPTDVEVALEIGLTVVKFFPAEASGGIGFLKALSAPYRQVRFIPTGGIDESNLLDYLKFPPVIACGGSWMVKSELIAAGKFDEITAISRRAVSTMLGFRLSHVGIASSGPAEALQNAGFLAKLLRLEMKEGNSSVFVDTQFEFVKDRPRGTHGHLAIGTNFIHRAVAYCAAQGIGILEETRSERGGELRSVYLDREVAGFAIHLLQV